MAKQAQSKEVVLPIELTIAEQTFRALADVVGSDNIQQPVKDLLQDLLRHYSQGGFMVTATDIDRMSKAAGQRVSSAKQVVEVVDAASGRKAGAYEFHVQVDPNMIETFRDVAASRGMTLEDVVSEAWNSAVSAGWLYAVPVPCENFFFNEAQHKAIADAIGKDSFTSQDIVKAVSK